MAEKLKECALEEKAILAPSLRLGWQWLDQAAFLAGGIANCRILTPDRLMLDLADPELRRQGFVPASREKKIWNVVLILIELQKKNADGDGYFSRLPASLPLAETILAAVEDMEHVKAGRLSEAVFPPEKSRELAIIARHFRHGLIRSGLAGMTGTTAAALKTVCSGGFRPFYLILPAVTAETLSPAMEKILAAWPGDWLFRLSDPEGGNGVEPELFLADSVANEAREIFRRTAALGAKLEDVEVVTLDPRTQVPALCAAALEIFGGRLEDLPLTVDSGLPAYLSRPARLLSAWIDWLEAGLPPKGLADMLTGGLFHEGWRRDAPGVSSPDLAKALRALPINGLPSEYLTSLASATDTLRGMDNKGEFSSALAWLRETVQLVLPAGGRDRPTEAGSGDMFRSARNLLDCQDSVATGKLDAYSAKSLRLLLDTWLPLVDNGGWPSFPALAWLRENVSSLRVMGLGPRPGRLYVSDFPNGGHAGRNVIFAMGMDDGSFPGSSREDPILLDRERDRLRIRKPGSFWRVRRERAFHRLLAQARGRLFLSRSCRDVRSGRELMPGLAFSRLAENNPVPPEAALRPDKSGTCLVRRDEWLCALPASRGHFSIAGLAGHYPGLVQGERAVAARFSSTFGEYDGFVPEARDFFLNGQKPLSASSLEALAACPLDFFFNRILEIRPPERYEPEPGRWLDGRTRGTLLHEVFKGFVQATMSDRTPSTGWEQTILRILDAELKRTGKRFPPANLLAAEREKTELRRAAEIFVAAEAERRREGQPREVEWEIGKYNAPVVVDLEGGRRIATYGILDRVDVLDKGGFRILDYKTGNSGGFSAEDPFKQGRHLQPFLYMKLLEKAPPSSAPAAPPREFVYFFPMSRDEGRNSIVYSAQRLEDDGKRIVSNLLSLLEDGVFPFTNVSADAAHSLYAVVHGDSGKLAKSMEGKMADPKLAAWAALRGVRSGRDGAE
jgi:hypothetical protein